jgi:hypothetical protein
VDIYFDVHKDEDSVFKGLNRLKLPIEGTRIEQNSMLNLIKSLRSLLVSPRDETILKDISAKLSGDTYIDLNSMDEVTLLTEITQWIVVSLREPWESVDQIKAAMSLVSALVKGNVISLLDVLLVRCNL